MKRLFSRYQYGLFLTCYDEVKKEMIESHDSGNMRIKIVDKNRELFGWFVQ